MATTAEVLKFMADQKARSALAEARGLLANVAEVVDGLERQGAEFSDGCNGLVTQTSQLVRLIAQLHGMREAAAVAAK